MTKSLLAACAVVAFMCHQVVAAEELTFGSKAPKLEVKKFLKGEPVKNFEKGKIYVVELWATWCGPCIASIPHLSELQKNYKDVTFIGVAVLEEDEEGVSAFVEDMGKKMEYRVAMDLIPEGSDPGDGKFVKNWMEPAEQQGIPTAFIINGEGQIAWIGHPLKIDDPLEQIVSGKWDLVAEAKTFEEARAAEREANKIKEKMQAIQANLQKLYSQFNDDGKPDELLAAIDSAEKEIPENATGFQMLRFQVLSLTKDRADDAIAVANSLIESEHGEEFNLLNHIAWIIVNPDRDEKADPKLLKFALKVALKADNLAKAEDPSVADTLAKAYFDNGDIANAVKTQTRVVELAEGTRLAADPGVQKRLKQYKKALSNATKATEEKSPQKPPKS